MKKLIGKLALAVSFITIVWLVVGMIMLGIYDIDLLIFKIPGTTEIRSHATLAVINEIANANLPINFFK